MDQKRAKNSVFVHKNTFFAEILFADHSLSEEVILNEVSLRGSPTIILPWSYMGWHRRCHKITNAHTFASQTATKEQKCCLTYVSKCKSILCDAYYCFFTLLLGAKNSSKKCIWMCTLQIKFTFAGSNKEMSLPARLQNFA